MKIIKKIWLRLPIGGRRSKKIFMKMLKEKNCKILDVGCGNDSPEVTKYICPDSYYVGVDVGNYNNDEKPIKYADKYILLQPESFSEGIAGLAEDFDVVISSHNIEYCNKPQETLKAFCSRIKKGGMLFLAFPNEESINFLHREGTQNFYDDPTHIYLPRYEEITGLLRMCCNMQILFSTKGYKPLFPYIAGVIVEPFSHMKKRCVGGRLTWAFWGFETIIWARKM